MSDNDFPFRFSEEESLQEVYDYLKQTYGAHYVGNKQFQTVDMWESLGSVETTCRDTAIKYLARYGKKDGRNRKDLLKAIHYIVLMMHYGKDK